jgi:tRNA 2-thiouridine synthesizing protein E
VQVVNTDRDGFLKDLSDWSADTADQLAESESIVLTEDHWELINLIRDFYMTYKISPTMRVLVRRTGEKLGPEKGRSIHLLTLFPDSPLKLLSKIAGLPKPPNCD